MKKTQTNTIHLFNVKEMIKWQILIIPVSQLSFVKKWFVFSVHFAEGSFFLTG